MLRQGGGGGAGGGSTAVDGGGCGWEPGPNTPRPPPEILIEDIIQPENSSQRISEVVSEHHSLPPCTCDHAKLDVTCQRENCSGPTNNNTKVNFETVKVDDEDEDLNYHFHGKNELLASITEEHLLDHLEVDYLGECISSCNKVENFLMYSEYEENMDSDGFSFNSSQAHSEQVTAPLKKKRGGCAGQLGNLHSFSEPDIFRLSNRLLVGGDEEEGEKGNEDNQRTWHHLRSRDRRPLLLPVIREVGSADIE